VHILIFTDQHPDSLGGAQVAVRTQRTALEHLGHRVTIAAPALRRAGHQVAAEDRQVVVELASRAVTRDKEYGFVWPGRRTLRALQRQLMKMPPVDVVHAQGDFWGAMLAVRAARKLSVPLVFTLHNNVDRGTHSVTPFAPLAFLGLRLWRWLVLGRARGTVSRQAKGAWRYLATLVAEAQAVVAPSQHFADQLVRHHVALDVVVIRGGVDDDLIRRVGSEPRPLHARPRLVWLGRMSREKRVLEFIDALAASDVDADVRLYGSGALRAQIEARIDEAGLANRVSIVGPVSHEEALGALRDADALVQTSLGFETQGLTPFEAAALGTPTIFCDGAIADDAGVTPSWRVPDDTVSSLADTLRGAVRQLVVKPQQMRVATAQAQRFLQSEQTRSLVQLYERVLRSRGKGEDKGRARP
jgi:1,2-diacylglycerol 3-alpha-glucosyltransferase